jgi:poly(3-hydroxybutyrate) depolymerase
MQQFHDSNSSDIAGPPNWLTHPPGLRELALMMESAYGLSLRQPGPAFGIDGMLIGPPGQAKTVHQQTVIDAPFCRLLHFGLAQLRRPAVLVVAPMSGHSAAQLSDTILALLPEHDVYLTDWRDARDVPLAEGAFGLDDYIDYLLRFIDHIGPGAQVLAICQSCVPALAAVTLLAQDEHPAQPDSLTLMAGPIDARLHPSPVNRFATGAPLAWFEHNLISTVAPHLPGAGRRVYAGPMQVLTSLGMESRRRMTTLAASWIDPVRCWQAMLEISNPLPAQQPVMDLTAEFYLDNLRDVFQDYALARGCLEHRGRLLQPQLIKRTALLTVEAGKDEVCGAGQTQAAHHLCPGIPESRKSHFVAQGATHRDVFSGAHWRKQVFPQVRKLLMRSRH